MFGRGIGPPEIILILLIILLLFGAKKLPDLARGVGRSLRIFKAETKGLLDDEEDPKKTEEQRQIDAQRSSEAATRVENAEEQPRPDAER